MPAFDKSGTPLDPDAWKIEHSRASQDYADKRHQLGDKADATIKAKKRMDDAAAGMVKSQAKKAMPNLGSAMDLLSGGR